MAAVLRLHAVDRPSSLHRGHAWKLDRAHGNWPATRQQPAAILVTRFRRWRWFTVAFSVYVHDGDHPLERRHFKSTSTYSGRVPVGEKRHVCWWLCLATVCRFRWFFPLARHGAIVQLVSCPWTTYDENDVHLKKTTALTANQGGLKLKGSRTRTLYSAVPQKYAVQVLLVVPNFHSTKNDKERNCS